MLNDHQLNQCRNNDRPNTENSNSTQHVTVFMHRRRRRGARAPQIRAIFYHVNFGHFSENCRIKFVNFVNFSQKNVIKNSGILIIFRTNMTDVKFGHLKNFHRCSFQTKLSSSQRKSWLSSYAYVTNVIVTYCKLQYLFFPSQTLTMLLVVLYFGPMFVITLSIYDEANRYLDQTQITAI